jgi:hypothetical protein
MNNKLEKILKEAVMACSSYITGIFLEGLSKWQIISVSVANVPADIRTENFSNTSVERPLSPLPMSFWCIDVNDQS